MTIKCLTPEWKSNETIIIAIMLGIAKLLAKQNEKFWLFQINYSKIKKPSQINFQEGLFCWNWCFSSLT